MYNDGSHKSSDPHSIENIWNVIKATIREKCLTNCDKFWKLIQAAYIDMYYISDSACQNFAKTISTSFKQ